LFAPASDRSALAMPTFLELPLPCASAGGKRTQLMQAVDVSSSAEDIPIKQLSPNTLGQIDGGKTDVQEHLGRTIFCTTKPSPAVQHGRRSVCCTPDLFAPADDRNALATPTAGGIALAG